MHRILILDDDPAILKSLELILTQVGTVFTTSDNLKILDTIQRIEPDVLLSDMNFSRARTDGAEGIQVLKKVQESYPELPVVVMTAFSDLQLAVRSIQLGAYDFVEKPWTNERLMTTLSNAMKMRKARNDVAKAKALSMEVSGDQTSLGMIGDSPAINLARERIRKVARTDANVLILGENGTGKELVAKAIHDLSDRSGEAFVKIDLGSIHEQLFESELFGARKGAYTGLNEHKIGRMSLANGGSLFLDELANLDMPLQSKLLSALQNREIVPVGGTKAESIDIRLISATNVGLADLLDQKRFRQDLLYRVNTIEIHMPALRDREGDIPILLNHFTEKFCQRYQKPLLKLDQAMIKAAEAYHWPGNVRELEHAVERAVIMSDGKYLNEVDLIPRSRDLDFDKSSDLNLERTEIRLLKAALKQSAGNISKASELLGITRNALYRRMEKHNL